MNEVKIPTNSDALRMWAGTFSDFSKSCLVAGYAFSKLGKASCKINFPKCSTQAKMELLMMRIQKYNFMTYYDYKKTSLKEHIEECFGFMLF
jgi:hypothetical protein